jgi:hypothetical protein
MARAHRQIWICEYTPQRVLSLLVMVDRKRRARDLPRTGAEYAERIKGIISHHSEVDIRPGRKRVTRHVWLSESLRHARQL